MTRSRRKLRKLFPSDLQQHRRRRDWPGTRTLGYLSKDSSPSLRTQALLPILPFVPASSMARTHEETRKSLFEEAALHSTLQYGHPTRAQMELPAPSLGALMNLTLPNTRSLAPALQRAIPCKPTGYQLRTHCHTARNIQRPPHFPKQASALASVDQGPKTPPSRLSLIN